MTLRTEKLPFSTRVAAVKAALDFETVAAELGYKGSTRSGWQCSHCDAPSALKARPDGQGGRCGVCEKGFDILTLVSAARHCDAGTALRVLEKLVLARAAKAAAGQERLL